MAQQVTIESVAVKLLKSGKSAKETLESVRKVFPQAKTSMKCIYYYSSKHKLGLQKSQVVDAEALRALMTSLEPKQPAALKPTGTQGK